MNSSKIISVIVMISMMVSFSAIAAVESDNAAIAKQPADVQYPFIAKVTTNNVYIRSGKGTAYYACGKANTGDLVTVVGQAFGWAEIIPPKGSYSWIHKNYVDVKESQPTVGVLNGDNVRVWAGSDNIDPMRSSSMQTKLNTGEIIELLPDQPQTGDYYKIKPPAGAKLTVNCQFLEYVGPAEQKEPTTIPPRSGVKEPTLPASTSPASTLPPSTETSVPTFGNLQKDNQPSEPQPAATPEPAAATEETPKSTAPQPEPSADDSDDLKACYALSTKIDQVLQKPLAEQNYDSIKEELEKIKANTTDKKAATYAQILTERVTRYELAISVVHTLKEQDKALAEEKEKIQKTHEENLKNVHREADFLYTGFLKVSHVYTSEAGRKRYLLQGSDGKILCYAVPISRDVAAKFETLLGKRVGIQGDVSKESNSLVTLVSATAVEPI